MATQFDAQKASARKELDRLHRGIIVDLDRRLVQSSGAGQADITPMQGTDEPELSEAVKIVERTALTLQLLKDAASRQEKLIGENADRIRALEAENQSLVSDRLDLTTRLDAESMRVDELINEKKLLEDKTASLEEECRALSTQLKQLAGLIKSSLHNLIAMPS